jgi:phospholipid transport system substrate-binding protein
MFKPLNRFICVLFLFCAHAAVQAQEAPDKLIQRVTGEVLDAVRSNNTIRQGDVQSIRQLVEEKIVPHLDFERTTALAAGRYWREATDAQKQQLQTQFKALLMHTYSGALAQVKDQAIVYDPIRSSDTSDVVVNAHTTGSQGQKIDFGYRLRQLPEGWKVYDVNVLGVWMVQVYRDNFATVIRQSGIDGLISSLTEKNRGLAERENRQGRATTNVPVPGAGAP